MSALLSYSPVLIGEYWALSITRDDPYAVAMYERHYSYKKSVKRAKKIGGPGRYLAWMTNDRDALFLWIKELHRKDGQQGINCSIFRNESKHLSSDLIKEACLLAWRRWPGERLFTFVDPRKIKNKSNPGYCFLLAGWRKCGVSKTGLLIFELMPSTETFSAQEAQAA